MPNGRAVWSGEITSGVRRYVQLLQHEACRRHPQFPDCCNPRIEDWQHGPLGMLRYIWEDDVDIIWKDRSRIVTLPDSGVRIGVGGKTSEVPGFYKKDRVSKPVIYVYQRYESNDPRSRRAQFTVFHELAHYLLDTLPLMLHCYQPNWKPARIGAPLKNAYATLSPRIVLFPMNC